MAGARVQPLVLVFDEASPQRQAWPQGSSIRPGRRSRADWRRVGPKLFLCASEPLHRRAAEALIEAKGEPEAVAHHFTEAGLDDLAIEWWGKAGDETAGQRAIGEATKDSTATPAAPPRPMFLSLTELRRSVPE